LLPSIGFLLAIEPCAGQIKLKQLKILYKKKQKYHLYRKNGHHTHSKQLQHVGLNGFGQGHPLVGHETVLGQATFDLHQGLLFIDFGMAHALAVYSRGGMSSNFKLAWATAAWSAKPDNTPPWKKPSEWCLRIREFLSQTAAQRPVGA
jgi:hypothetical protein